MIAMVAVRMVKVPGHEVIDVIAVRDRFVAAIGSVPMAVRVGRARMGRGALGRVCPVDRDGMFVEMVPVRMMEMPVVQIIDVPVMNDGRVSATGSMKVRVSVFRVGGAGVSEDQKRGTGEREGQPIQIHGEPLHCSFTDAEHKRIPWMRKRFVPRPMAVPKPCACDGTAFTSLGLHQTGFPHRDKITRDRAFFCRDASSNVALDWIR
jgi:hypothetical protein